VASTFSHFVHLLVLDFPHQKFEEVCIDASEVENGPALPVHIVAVGLIRAMATLLSSCK
jgi:hypothetical protein